MNLELPENTCAYERYDPDTLEPLSSEAEVRLQELGWSARDFAGKTVLDIGCNSGFLTLHALRLGAARIHACDVQPALVEFVSRVVAAKKLPVTVTRTAFNDLRPQEDGADIVLFMEVLHWAVSQGLPLRRVIQRLTELTRELLYLEFPWSIKEPSIQKQTKLTEELYSAEAVLDELTRYFTEVRIVRFMRYFGFNSRSVRVLVEARGKRPEAEVLSQLPNVYSLDTPLSRGRNESYLLSSPRGPLVAKLLTASSPLSRIPRSLCDRMFNEIADNKPRTILLPEKFQDSFLLISPEEKRWMTFPFVGRVPFLSKRKAPSTKLEPLIDLFINVRRDLRPVSGDLLAALRENNVYPNVAAVVVPDAPWLVNPEELEPIRESLLQAIAELQALDPMLLDSLCHGDLQTGNFVLDENNQVKVIDLDNICVSPIYSDGLVGLIWRGFGREGFGAFCGKLAREEVRPATKTDATFAIAKSLIWFTAVRAGRESSEIQAQITRLVTGLTEAMAFSASLPAAKTS